MTISTEPKPDCDGQDQQNPVGLVWEETNPWRWVSTCGRFKIERFTTGEHEYVGFSAPSRYRALKHTPGWFFEFAPTEASLAAAQQACEIEMTRGM